MTPTNWTAKQLKEYRLKIVSECLIQGFSQKEIAIEVMAKMGLTRPPAKSTISTDRKVLFEEWQAERLDNMDELVKLELKKIDYACMQLWKAWHRSATDQKTKSTKQKGYLPKSEKGKKSPSKDDIVPSFMEQGTKEEINFGDPRYISEIRFQLAERRKLLDMYPAQKTDLRGKDGKDLIPEESADLDKLTKEDKLLLLDIARKVEYQ